MPRSLSTAEERREAVLAAALGVFAARGYHGTPTTDVARAAGISHAYLFRLFPTKADLFVAVVDRCHERLIDTFRTVAAQAEPGEELSAMGMAYVDLLADRDLLRVQLHAHAAAEEPAIRDAVRAGFGRVYEAVRAASGADEETLAAFLSKGMLLNVLASMGAGELDEPWARALAPPGL